MKREIPLNFLFTIIYLYIPKDYVEFLNHNNFRGKMENYTFLI